MCCHIPPAAPLPPQKKTSNTTQFGKVVCGIFTFLMTVTLRSKYLLRKRYILCSGHLWCVCSLYCKYSRINNFSSTYSGNSTEGPICICVICIMLTATADRFFSTSYCIFQRPGCVIVKEQQNIPSKIIFMIDYVPVLCSVLLATYHLDNQIKEHEMDGYVTCMGERRDAYNIFVGRSDGKRTLGRTRRR